MLFCMVIQCMDSIKNVILYGYSMHGQHQECYFVWLFNAQTASGMLFCMVQAWELSSDLLFLDKV